MDQGLLQLCTIHVTTAMDNLLWLCHYYYILDLSM